MPTTASMDEKPILEEVEEKAGEQLGIRKWDLPSIFREAASAATDADLPYWTVLVLSGAIATLGLAMNSSAVVIGAMLIAPLLAPVVGLALALAVGDSRLAFQTALMVGLSTLAVVLFSAVLTLLLPFQTVTSEVAARTTPTTLDLVIAVFSGLAGVVVTVARGHRLSAAIPGVAIAVALIPPLAVAGFGLGAGPRWDLVRGSLLLYGANLAGIVLSGMLVFMLVGMHRENVLATAREWHRSDEPTGIIAWVDRKPWVQELGIIDSWWARVGLVLGFVVAVAVPLTRTLEEITREARVRSAVDQATEQFELPGRSSVIDQQLVRTSGQTQVYLRVATREWFGPEARTEFTRVASALAGEPIHLVLQQLPATTGDVEELADLLAAGQPPAAAAAATIASPTQFPDLLSEVRNRLEEAVASLALPREMAVAGTELAVSGAGGVLRVGYASPSPLPVEALQILALQMTRALDVPGMEVELVHVGTGARALGAAEPDTLVLRETTDLLRRFPDLHAEVVGPDSARSRTTRAGLIGPGIGGDRVTFRVDTASAPQIRLFARSPAGEP